MPVPEQRDPVLTREVLARWLATKLPEAGDVAVPDLESVTTRGLYSETLLFDAEWTLEGTRHQESLVARVTPVRYQLFPEPRFAEQYRLIKVLGERTDIPVPPMRWYEPDATLLGGPFFVTGRVAGDTTRDMPPYHHDGWLTSVRAEERTRVWWSSIETLARLHQLNVTELRLSYLDQPEYGETGIDQRLGYYAHYLRWAYHGSHPTAEKALEWLRANRPAEPDPPVLLWGDARLGNMVFSGGKPVALLDWENATLGQPEEDLSWFCYLDRHDSEGIGVERLPGFPSREETSARYAELLGRPLRDLDYYEVLSGFKLAVIMARIGQAFIDFELIPPDSRLPYNNTAAQLLAKTLGLPSPG